MILGHAAGVAAAMVAASSGMSVRDVHVGTLQAKLRAAGQILEPAMKSRLPSKTTLKRLNRVEELAESQQQLAASKLLKKFTKCSDDSCRQDNEPYGKAGEYDFVVFARFWMGEPSTNISCGSFAASNLTLHGIWPQYTDKRDSHLWPQFCNTSSAATGVSEAVQQKMMPLWQQYAPAYPDASDLKYHGLTEHEWNRHGVCWNSSVNQLATADNLEVLQLEFFKHSINLMQRFPTPTLLGNALRAKATIPLAELQSAFGGRDMVTLQCDADGHLTMVSLCFDKQLLKQVTCPTSVLKMPYQNSCVIPKTVDPVKVAFDCNPN